MHATVETPTRVKSQSVVDLLMRRLNVESDTNFNIVFEGKDLGVYAFKPTVTYTLTPVEPYNVLPSMAFLTTMLEEGKAVVKRSNN